MERSSSLVEKCINHSEVAYYEVVEKTTVFSGDSLCVTHLDVKIRDMYGKTFTSVFEYVILWTIPNKKSPKSELKEYILPIEGGRKPLLVFTKDFYEKDFSDNKTEWERYLRINAAILGFFSWQDVE